MLLRIIVILFGFTPSIAMPNLVEVQNKAYWICKSRKDVRTIRVFVDGDGQCITYYSKQGTERNVGNGRYQETCLNFLNNIKTNLENSNWSCRDISATRITASDAKE